MSQKTFLLIFILGFTITSSFSNAEAPKAIPLDVVNLDLIFSSSGKNDPSPDQSDILAVDKKRLEVMREESRTDERIVWDDAKYMKDLKVTDPQARKSNFLKNLSKSIPSGKHAVNLNMAGHGILGTDGKWYFNLPSNNAGKTDTLYVDSKHNQEHIQVNGKKVKNLVVDVNHPEFRGNFISFDELAASLHDAGINQIYGTVASCHSGGICKDMGKLRSMGVEASLITGAPDQATMSGYASTGTTMNDFMNQVRMHPERYDANGDRQISFGELRNASETLRTDEMNSRVTAKNNLVEANVGFQPKHVDTKFFGAPKSLDSRIIYSYAAPGQKPANVVPETHVTGNKTHSGQK